MVNDLDVFASSGIGTSTDRARFPAVAPVPTAVLAITDAFMALVVPLLILKLFAVAFDLNFDLDLVVDGFNNVSRPKVYLSLALMP
jgi:hypothetical protein